MNQLYKFPLHSKEFKSRFSLIPREDIHFVKIIVSRVRAAMVLVFSAVVYSA